jgi:hypothetical protein
LVVLATLWVPVGALAQDSATIAGTVRDASGAVLPGVTVEAASSALIEKVRSVTTDGGGRYSVVALPPGSYSLTFTLPGFNTVRQENIQLTAAVTASINAELRVGNIQETVTVTGESPIVDTRSARRQQVIDGDVLQSLPTSRSYNDVLQLAPGVVAGNGQAQLRPGMLLFTAHGGNTQDGRLTLDGINTGASRGGAGVSGYIPDMQNAQEVTFTISGSLGEAETGGPQMTVIPKAGGNSLSGTAQFSGFTDKMQGNNYDDKQLNVLGKYAPALLVRDYQASVGGPVKKDRMWFFFNYRAIDAADAQPGIFANRNAGDPTKWTYEPDTTRQGRADPHRKIASLRLTTQVTPKNKLMVFWDEQPQCNGAGWNDDDHCNSQKDGWIYGGSQTNGFFGAGPNSPETGDYASTHQSVRQAKYTGTITSRLLLEAGYGAYLSQWGYTERPGNPTAALIRVQEQTTQFFDANGNRVAGATPGGISVAGGLKYRSSNWPTGYISANTWSASASYVTGAHNMKFGYMGALHKDDDNLFDIITNDQRMTYRFGAGVNAAGQTVGYGVPNQVTIQAGPWTRYVRTGYAAFYAQDQWTKGRMTLQGALRFDRAYSRFPEQTIAKDVWWPTEFVIPEAKGVDAYLDLSPRAGLAYDVFGTGKTSLKANVGRYLHPASNAGRFDAANPAARVVTLASRPWTDANGNFTVDCNVLDASVQDLRATGGDVCGQGDPNYGRNRATTTLDPSVLQGWKARPYDWQLGVSVQQELMPRVSAEVGYYRRWWPIYDGADVTDNLAASAADYGQFSVVAPTDSRLPNGGGYTVNGLYNITPAAAARASDNLRKAANSYGDYTRYWDGFDMTFQARLLNGVTVQGGTSTGRLVEDTCSVRPQSPEGMAASPFGGVGAGGLSSLLNPYCRQVEPFSTTYKANATYLVPRVDVQVSGTFSSRPGAVLRADAIFQANDPTILATLGRPLAATANVTVPLIAPYEAYGDRIDQVDMRIGKILRFGRTRSNLSLDIINMFNSNDNLAYQTLLSPTWPAPTQVLLPRIFRVNFGVDW